MYITTTGIIVWRMNSAEWLMKGDPRLRGPYHQKIPKVQAILEWDNVGVVRKSLCCSVLAGIVL